MSREVSAATQGPDFSTRTRLPLGTVIKDAAGRVGTIVDTGLDEDYVSRIYYVRDAEGEWKTGADVTVLSGWPVAGGTA